MALERHLALLLAFSTGRKLSYNISEHLKIRTIGAKPPKHVQEASPAKQDVRFEYFTYLETVRIVLSSCNILKCP